mgnify:CR=1 FL=1
MKFKIDNLQYCNWSRKIFEINREAGLDAVHVTIVYHEDFDEHLNEIQKWKKLFEENSDLIFLGNNFKDIEKANKEKKTAIFFGFQNCSPIEDDINLVERVHELGCRFTPKPCPTPTMTVPPTGKSSRAVIYRSRSRIRTATSIL